MSETFEMVAKTLYGLEEILAGELLSLGANDIQIGRRMVSFTGDKEVLYKANFYCRTALRILKPIYHFKYRIYSAVAYRRIGRNELGAIAVCRGFIDAQIEYAAMGHDGQTAGLFAAKLRSDAGQQNGLYWPVGEGEPASPAGEEVVSAAAEGYKTVVGQRTPYHGYYYRILYAQGAAANGGSKEYFVEGQLRDGVALIAWPADYANSGVMTFMVNHEGRVYQKDLGAETATVVEAIQLFDPDKSWSLVVSEEGD